MANFDITGAINAAIALAILAKQRDASHTDYERMKNSSTDDFYTVSDSVNIEPLLYAYNKRNALVKEVHEKSQELFDSLPDALRFGIKELGKPLILPESGPPKMTAARCLVVTVKPVDPKPAVSAVLSEPEYLYDVKVVDLSGSR